MSSPKVKDFFNPDGSVREETEEEAYAEMMDKSGYDSAVRDVRDERGGRRWPGRSSKRRRRKSRRKSKRRKSKKKKRKRKRKRTKKRRRKRRR